LQMQRPQPLTFRCPTHVYLVFQSPQPIHTPAREVAAFAWRLAPRRTSCVERTGVGRLGLFHKSMMTICVVIPVPLSLNSPASIGC
jgi:hypothetical protein